MKETTLKNGIKVLFKKTSSPTVTVHANIAVGSVNEEKNQAGYSHFVEHMLFEGTKKRTNLQIANEIETVGGELNAATSHDRTYFYIKVPKKYVQKATDLIADMISNSTFIEKNFEKEKKIILSEIDMIQDDPKIYQWTLLQKNLFSSNLKRPIIGNANSINKCKREDLVNYYKKYYTAGNIILTIAGNFEKPNLKIFEQIPKGRKTIKVKENRLEKNKKVSVKRNIQQSYIVMGFKTPSRKEKDSFAVDVFHSIFGRGVSGRIFDELRNKQGLGYSVFAYNDAGKYSGLYGISVSTKKENIPKVKKSVLKLLKKPITEKEIKEGKRYLLGKMQMEREDSKNVADSNSMWMYYAGKTSKDYENGIKNVKLKDLERIISKYFSKFVIAEIKNI